MSLSIRLHGNESEASKQIRLAQEFLRRLKLRKELGGLEQLQTQVVLPDGSVVLARSIFDQDFIHIWSGAAGAVEPVISKKVRYYYFNQFCYVQGDSLEQRYLKVTRVRIDPFSQRFDTIDPDFGEIPGEPGDLESWVFSYPLKEGGGIGYWVNGQVLCARFDVDDPDRLIVCTEQYELVTNSHTEGPNILCHAGGGPFTWRTTHDRQVALKHYKFWEFALHPEEPVDPDNPDSTEYVMELVGQVGGFSDTTTDVDMHYDTDARGDCYARSHGTSRSINRIVRDLYVKGDTIKLLSAVTETLYTDGRTIHIWSGNTQNEPGPGLGYIFPSPEHQTIHEQWLYVDYSSNGSGRDHVHYLEYTDRVIGWGAADTPEQGSIFGTVVGSGTADTPVVTPHCVLTETEYVYSVSMLRYPPAMPYWMNLEQWMAGGGWAGSQHFYNTPIYSNTKVYAGSELWFEPSGIWFTYEYYDGAVLKTMDNTDRHSALHGHSAFISTIFPEGYAFTADFRFDVEYSWAMGYFVWENFASGYGWRWKNDEGDWLDMEKWTTDEILRYTLPQPFIARSTEDLTEPWPGEWLDYKIFPYIIHRPNGGLKWGQAWYDQGWGYHVSMKPDDSSMFTVDSFIGDVIQSYEFPSGMFLLRHQHGGPWRNWMTDCKTWPDYSFTTEEES